MCMSLVEYSFNFGFNQFFFISEAWTWKILLMKLVRVNDRVSVV